jgi:hypothetical protein
MKFTVMPPNVNWSVEVERLVAETWFAVWKVEVKGTMVNYPLFFGHEN